MSTDLQMSQSVPAARGELSVSASTATAIAEVQASYVMAMQNRRNIFEARDRMLEACERKRFSEKARYHRPVGKDRYGNQTFADGFSVHFARPAAVMMRNISLATGVSYEDEKIRKVWARATDLEANVPVHKEGIVEKTIEKRSAQGREVISERTNSYGDTTFLVVAYPHEVDLKAAKLMAILLRDCVIPLIPPDLLDEVEEKIIDVMAAELTSDPVTARKKMVDAFKAIGISSKQLADYLGHPIEDIAPQEFADLRAAYTTIKDGNATWADYAETSNRKPPETSTLAPEDLQPGNPEDHTDVRTPLKQEAAPKTSKIGTCEKYLIQLFENWHEDYLEFDNAAENAANRFMQEQAVDVAKMPDKGLDALKTFVNKDLIPHLQKTGMLPEGEIKTP